MRLFWHRLLRRFTIGYTLLRTYDHSALAPTIRPTDIFLCSYPKSGTTWVGYLLAQLLKKDSHQQLGLDTFNELVPDVNLIYTKRGSLAEFDALPDPRFFLCHAPFEPLFQKVIYVMRDPRDVMVSYWHYQKLVSRDFKLSLLEFARDEKQWPCHWNEHVASWLKPIRHPAMVVIKYEDLHRDPLAEMLKVRQLANADWSVARIESAIDASRFDQMRAAEEKFGLKAKAGDESERFVRKGQAGAWKEELGPAELKVIEARCGQLMREFGYPPSVNQDMTATDEPSNIQH